MLLPHRNSSGKEPQEENLNTERLCAEASVSSHSIKPCFIQQSHEVTVTLATAGVGTFHDIPVAGQSILERFIILS